MQRLVLSDRQKLPIAGSVEKNWYNQRLKELQSSSGANVAIAQDTFSNLPMCLNGPSATVGQFFLKRTISSEDRAKVLIRSNTLQWCHDIREMKATKTLYKKIMTMRGCVRSSKRHHNLCLLRTEVPDQTRVMENSRGAKSNLLNDILQLHGSRSHNGDRHIINPGNRRGRHTKAMKSLLEQRKLSKATLQAIQDLNHHGIESDVSERAARSATPMRVKGIMGAGNGRLWVV